MTQQAFNDEFSGQELFEDFESIGVKKVRQAKLDLEKAWDEDGFRISDNLQIRFKKCFLMMSCTKMLQLLQVPLEIHFLEHCFGFIEIFRCTDVVKLSIRVIGL